MIDKSEMNELRERVEDLLDNQGTNHQIDNQRRQYRNDRDQRVSERVLQHQRV